MNDEDNKDLVDKSVYQKTVNECKTLRLLFQTIVDRNVSLLSQKEFDSARKIPNNS